MNEIKTFENLKRRKIELYKQIAFYQNKHRMAIEAGSSIYEEGELTDAEVVRHLSDELEVDIDKHLRNLESIKKELTVSDSQAEEIYFFYENHRDILRMKLSDFIIELFYAKADLTFNKLKTIFGII